jgi:hypothetical protein
MGIMVAAVDSFLLPITLTIGLLLTSRFFEKIENFIKPKK